MSSGITFRHKGNFSKTEQFINRILHRDYLNVLDRYAQMCLDQLASATPKDSGQTAASWGYEIVRNSDSTSISFYNTNIQNGANIAILLQYGHGTKNGGYVVGRDYINPVIRPAFDKIAEEVWKEVTSS